MNDSLIVFKEQEILGKHFRVFGTPDEPLFLARDVAEWIEYSEDKVGQMLKSVDETEYLTSPIFSSGQVRNMYFLTEDGLYEVLMQSRKPIAKEFKKEVKTILRDVRKYGTYMTTETLEKAMADPDFLIGIVKAYKEEKEKRTEAENKLIEQEPKVKMCEEFLIAQQGIDMDEAANVLKEPDMGRNKLFLWLRKNKMLMDGERHNIPYARYSDYFEVIEVNNNGMIFSKCTVKPAGLALIRKKLNKEKRLTTCVSPK